MVMETPSPQCVGREFVRQYYTLLHEAPMHLHRFYSHNSCFVHGGIEKPGEEQPPVMGQQDIHKKIMSLNFRDCHAKIRQVDSQATVGNAVVVQVTGELSNNGETMRRFMQTFVLAPQSPKKYYVHNDIFRYQDEVFHDEENDDSTEELIVDSEPENLDDSVPEEQTVEATIEDFEPPPVISNGTSHFDEVIEDTTQKQEDSEPEEPVDEVEEENEEVLPEEDDSQRVDSGITDEQSMTDYGMVKKPWSAIISGSSGNTVPTSQTIKPSPPKPETKAESVSPQPQRGPRPRDGFNMNRDSRDRNSLSRGEGDDADGVTNRRSRYPDTHQLFVGNLPHNITEDELRKFFSDYGKVMELRINRGASGGKVHVPNFGFVIFDSPEPVQAILKQKPIKYNGEHRLNVEEKKPRGDGMRMGGRGGPMRSGSGGPGNRGGFGSGRGMGMRGGFGRGDNRGPPGGGGNRGGFSGRR